MNVMGKLWIEGLVGDGDVASRIETAFESLESTTVSLRTKASVEECEAAKTLATNVRTDSTPTEHIIAPPFETRRLLQQYLTWFCSQNVPVHFLSRLFSPVSFAGVVESGS